MKQAYIICRGMEEFASAREQFALIVDRLQSAAVLGMEHGEVGGSRSPSDFRINELGDGLSQCAAEHARGRRRS